MEFIAAELCAMQHEWTAKCKTEGIGVRPLRCVWSVRELERDALHATMLIGNPVSCSRSDGIDPSSALRTTLKDDLPATSSTFFMVGACRTEIYPGFSSMGKLAGMGVGGAS